MAEMAPLRVGDLEVARGGGDDLDGEPPPTSMRGIENERFEPVPGLAPAALLGRGLQVAAQHPHLRGGGPPTNTIVVDTCVGNDRNRSLPVWNQMRTDYPERLAAGGSGPGRSGLRLLHPHARRPRRLEHPARQRALRPHLPEREVPLPPHRVGALEGDRGGDPGRGGEGQPAPRRGRGARGDGRGRPRESRTGCASSPTPGHTPGHCSLVLGEQEDGDAVITGDLIHHPFLIAEPDWAVPGVLGPGDGRPHAARVRRALRRHRDPGCSGRTSRPPPRCESRADPPAAASPSDPSRRREQVRRGPKLNAPCRRRGIASKGSRRVCCGGGRFSNRFL